ncbi:MAG: DUF2235 domain-containing protein [Candidatus Competibacteraceae bacterium]|nr:MAG: DUF2235 domain-containing protein [Candidatus Competibacteraceae bacterium]
MYKKIIILSDGTGNSAGKLRKTNVWRLYQALDLTSPPKPGQPRQIACYDDGVGTSSFLPLALLGGAFGWGLKRNVLNLYTFLCRNYEPGDRVYGFGFSRGAFTIRILIGLVANQGLVYADSEAELMRRAKWAFRAYRRERYKANLLVAGARGLRDGVVGCLAPLHDEARGAGERLARCWKAVRRPGLYQRDQIEKIERFKKAAGRARGEDQPMFAFVGLWDTVAAYGLPIDELTRAWSWLFPLSVPDHRLSEKVKRACHALAIDDERLTFHPVLWDEQNLPADQTITQVWFAGMHSNVGGGYADDALSYVSLNWIMAEAERAEDPPELPQHPLAFKPREREEIRDKADPCGKLYDSRRGLGGTYRYAPRKIETLTNDTVDPKDQVVIPLPKIHESVFARIKQGVDGYAPIGLPDKYVVLRADGGVSAVEEDNPTSIECSEQDRTRWERQEREVWSLVRRKRVVYYLSVVVAFALALFPLLRPATPACEGPYCALSPVISGVGKLLPDFASLWLNAYQSHPGAFSLLVLLLSAIIYSGSRLRVRIFDAMRKIWKDILKPGEASEEPHGQVAGRGRQLLRSSALYQRLSTMMKCKVLPFMAGLALLLVIVAVIGQGIFAIMSSTGYVCAGSKKDNVFSTKSLCWASGVPVEEGQRYQITLTITEPWKDSDITPGINGFGFESMPWTMYPGLLLRRNISEPWFKLIARIGAQGLDEYPLDLKPVGEPSSGQFTAAITARRHGEVFLFVNDAILPLPQRWQFFYNNNEGEAIVVIKPVVPSS